MELTSSVVSVRVCGVCVFKTRRSDSLFFSDIGTICSCVALATFKASIGSAKTGFLSISLSGVIEVEVATITAVFSAPAFGRELSIAFPSLFVESSSKADGFGTVSCSSDVCMGDGDDDLAIAGGIDAIDCVVIFSEVILTGLALLESMDAFVICSSVTLTSVSDVVFDDGRLIGLELALSEFHTFVSVDFDSVVDGCTTERISLRQLFLPLIHCLSLFFHFLLISLRSSVHMFALQ